MSASNPLLRRRHRRLLVEFGAGAAPVTLLTDSFNRADNATVLGSTDGGTLAAAPWAAGSGVWGINVNRAYISTPAGASTYDVAVVESGQSVVSVAFTLATAPVGGTGVILRYTDFNNYLRFEWQGAAAGQTVLVKKVAGVESVIASTTLTLNSGDTIKVSATAGNLLTGYVNGVAVVSGTDAANAAATKVGMQSINSTLVRYDNFVVTTP